MTYLNLRSNTWHFSRRVPVEIKNYDSREYVRYSLKTDSKKLAKRLAAIENAKLELYGQSLIATGKKHSHNKYEQIVDRAELLGFSYQSTSTLASGQYSDLYERLLYLENRQEEKQVEAVLGTPSEPVLMLDDLLPIFFDLRKEVKLDKSVSQYRKWQNPRKLAIRNFIGCIGNKAIRDLTRQDLRNFRDWWIDRIEIESLSRGTANKSLIYIKSIISTIDEEYQLDLNLDHIFKNLLFDHDPDRRPPFTTEHIVNVLLNPENLKGLDDVLQNILKVFAETGAHVDEQLGVLPQNIFLDAKIPHISIESHEKDKLKTKHRKRIIPLVGYALDAFKKYPQGFSHLVKEADYASNLIGKHLKENNLLPTEKHSAYSLRHSFQDRLTNSGCLDRIQTDLMGHRFKDRIKYGEGGSLEKKYQWLKKIQLKPE